MLPQTYDGERRSSTQLEWRRLLRCGAEAKNVWPENHSGRQGDSEAAWAIAVGAIRDGFSKDQLREAFADPKNKGGASYRKPKRARHARAQAVWFDRLWEKATAWAAVKPIMSKAEAVPEIEAFAAAVELGRWPGRTGSTDQAVVHAIVRVARQQGTVKPEASHRLLADESGVARKTVAAATRRLREAGWIALSRPGRGRTEKVDAGTHEEYREGSVGSIWGLRPQGEHPGELSRNDPNDTGTVSRRTHVGVITRHRPHDALTGRALGLSAGRVLDHLAVRAATPQELAQDLGLKNSRHLRYRLLRRLADAELIVQLPDGRWGLYARRPELDQVAMEWDAVGVLERRSAYHERERAGWLEWREHTRPERLKRQEESLRRKRAADQLAARPEEVTEDGEIVAPIRPPVDGNYGKVAPIRPPVYGNYGKVAG